MAAKAKMKEVSMEEALWKSADKLRGSVEPSEYKHVVLSLFFLKFASDKFEAQRAGIIADGMEKFVDNIAFYTKDNVFYLPMESRWSYIMENAKQDDIALKIDTALFTIEKTNPILKGALPDNYYSRLQIDTVKLASLLDEINKIDTTKDIELIQYARQITAKQVNLVQLMTYYSLGKWIVEEQQEGKERAKYGKQVLKKLSESLTKEFGRGFSETNLEYARKFYLTYADRISQTLFEEFAVKKSQTVFEELDKEQPFIVSWSHYLQLMRIENADERKFYEIESAKSSWGIRTLQRQYNSSLYERLALSRDKDEVMRLAKEGNVITKPQDIVKQPTVLEFLGLDEKAKYVESDLETAIINKLQKFLLEMGKGYLFEARQKRFTFNEDNYYVDLVFYNRLLRCYVLVDLKIDKLTHQDLGQMMMYVHYYDRYEKLPEENPTVGILLCKEKDDALVEITLPKDANIYASEYQLYLPDKKELQKKLKEWIEEGTDL